MKPDRRIGPFALAVYERVPQGVATGGLPIVLVHGTMDRATSLAKVARRLPDHHVIRYDRRGYGDSRLDASGSVIPLADTIEAQVTDLMAVIGTRPCVVVGHSMGGTVALAAAARSPELIRAVVAYEAPRPWTAGWAKPSTSTPNPSNGSGTPLEPEDQAEQFMRRMIGDSQWERLPASSRAKRRAEGPALVADTMALNAGPAYADADLVVPTIAAHGSHSRRTHIQSAVELARSTKHGELVIIEGAQHGAHLTHPDDYAGLAEHALMRATLL